MSYATIENMVRPMPPPLSLAFNTPENMDWETLYELLTNPSAQSQIPYNQELSSNVATDIVAGSSASIAQLLASTLHTASSMLSKACNQSLTSRDCAEQHVQNLTATQSLQLCRAEPKLSKQINCHELVIF